MRTNRILIAMFVAATWLLPANASATTSDEIAKARSERASLQGELDRVVAAHDKVIANLAITQDALVNYESQLVAAKAELDTSKRTTQERARKIYRTGGASFFEVLLSSRDLTDFARGMALLDKVAKRDSGDLIKVSRARAQVDDLRSSLRDKSAKQHRLAAELDSQNKALAGKFAIASSLEKKLVTDRETELRLKREAEARAAEVRRRARTVGITPVFGGGSLACPVAGPTSFTDTYGAPRPGGRRHQGVDMFAAYGTPTAAIVDAVITQKSNNSLGGITLWLRGGNGTTYYYAHLSGYAEGAVGEQVAAGTHVGYVGNSGDARGTSPHLHFEVHPGGGAAVDPYPTARAACG